MQDKSTLTVRDRFTSAKGHADAICDACDKAAFTNTYAIRYLSVPVVDGHVYEYIVLVCDLGLDLTQAPAPKNQHG